MKKVTFISAALLLVSTTSFAEGTDAETYIKYRENLMQNAKTHSKSIGAILKGKLATKENIVRHARALKEVSMMFPTAFPQGSDKGETRAKAEIWSNAKGFEKAAIDHQQAVDGLVKAADSADMAAIGDAMGKVGKSCKGCHKEFRAKK